METVFDNILIFHGTPENDGKYLLLKVIESGLILRSEKELIEAVNNRNEVVFLCGHDHTPNIVSLSNGKLM